jgi:hypothetical protein
MLTPRRSAQLGLGAACLILVSSVAVLVAGAADSQKTAEVQSNQPISTPADRAPQTQNHTAGLMSAVNGLPQTVAVVSKH